MSEEKELDAGFFIGQHFECIANELLEGGSTRKGLKSCGSSNALGPYEHEDSETGEVWYDAHCYSCKQHFNKEELHNSSLGPELGVESTTGEVKERKKFSLVTKQPPMTKDEVLHFIESKSYSSGDYRGIKDKYSKFYGHLTELDSSGKVIARYYPETQAGFVTGYKCRNHPKDFRYGKVGATGLACELSGQVKFKTGGKYLLIVGGEEDKAAAYQMLDESQQARKQTGFSAIPVVSPTAGEGSAAKQVAAQYEFCDQFDNIIIGMDNDEAGKEATEALIKVLPKEKVKIATWTKKDPNKMLNLGMSKQFVRDFYQAKPVIKSVIKTSSDLMEDMAEELLRPRITLPDYMHKLQQMTRGGLLQGRIYNIIGDTSVGKCLAKDTPVMMATGEILPVQGINEGDKIMGDDGSPRKVLSLSRGREKMYRIDQIKGESYTVNESHILSLKASFDCLGSGISRGDIVDISVKDWLLLGNKAKRSLKGYKADLRLLGEGNHVENPYLLGLWLADGDTKASRITFNSDDPELIDYARGLCKSSGYSLALAPDKRGSKAVCGYVSGGFRKFLRDNGVLGDKHIPKGYLGASYSDRLSLLAGILDGDGYVYHKCFELCMKDNRLVSDIVFLARSVGLSVNVSDKFSSCEGFDGGIYKRLSISGKTSKVPTVLSRKICGERKLKKDVLVTGITVTPLEEGDYYGFQIDGNKRFVLGDFTVTHNTTHVNNFFYHLIFNSPVKPGVISLENTAAQYMLDMISIHLGKNLLHMGEGKKILEYINREDIKEKYQDLMTDDYGEERFTILDEREGSIKNMELQLERMSSQFDCKVFVIDVLTDLCRGNTNEEQADHMTWQKNFVKDGNTIVNILHTKKPPTDKDGNSRRITEYDALGSSTFVQSSAGNILIARDKLAIKAEDKNTTDVWIPKMRGGDTGEAGKWFYEVSTRQCYDKFDYFKKKRLEE